jgi:outer membrane lipoprotein-sorting protein
MMSSFFTPTGAPDGRDDPVTPVVPGAELETRLRAHLAARYGPDPDPDVEWERPRPRLGGRRLGRRFDSAGASGWARSMGRSLVRRRWPLGLGAAGAVLVLGVAVSPRLSRPEPVSAEALLARAQAAGEAATARSYHLQATLTRGTGSGAGTTAIEEWVAGKVRTRRQTTQRDAGGAVVAEAGSFSDGSTSWSYTVAQGQTRVIRWDLTAQGGSAPNPPPERAQAAADAEKRKIATAQAAAGGTPATPGTPAPASRSAPPPPGTPAPGPEGGRLSGLLADLGTKVCGPARLLGEATVAGRTAYAIEVVPAPGGCSDGRGGPPFSRLALWLDKETLLELRAEQYGPGGGLDSRYEVTRLEMGVAIPESTFVYSPPPGAAVLVVTPDMPKAEVERFLSAGPSVLK